MKADIVTKNYLKDPVIFADIFNYYIYGGEQVIKPGELTEQDTAKIALPYGCEGESVTVQRFRDIQKLYTAMTDGKVEYILFGIESQANLHLAMPVRNYLYDALDYAGQVEQKAKLHKSTDSGVKKPDKDEFLSGFWREDKLIPSITLTIYFGSEKWQGPLSLFEMMEDMSPETFRCIDNYHVRLIAPTQLSDEDIMKFNSSMREVLLFIKYSNDDESLEKILQSDDRFKNLERCAAEVIESITKSGLKYERDEEVINMCEAIQQMRKKSEHIGEINAKKSAAENFYSMGMDIEKIAQGLREPIETIKEWLKIG